MNIYRALGAQPRSRKPAFVTHDNKASLCVKIYKLIGIKNSSNESNERKRPGSHAGGDKVPVKVSASSGTQGKKNRPSPSARRAVQPVRAYFGVQFE